MSSDEAVKQFSQTIAMLRFEQRRFWHENYGGDYNIPPSTDQEFEGVPRPLSWDDIATPEQIEEMRKHSHP